MNKRLFSLSLIFFLAAFANAQINEQVIDQCDADQAQFIVAQQVSESSTVTDRLKKIKILTVSADFMWDFDEPKAREYFTEAKTLSFEYFREKGIQRESFGDDARVSGAVIDPRFDVIRAIARRDGKWAQQISEELIAELEKSAKDRKEHELNHEISFLISVANEHVETNPDLSWFIYRMAMKRPIDFFWVNALLTVHGKKPEFAQALYMELINNYRTGDARSILLLSGYPFGEARVFGPDRYTFGAQTPPNLSATSTLQTAFLSAFINRVMTVVPGQTQTSPQSWRPPEPVYMVIALNELEPLVLESQPSFVPQLQAAKHRAMTMIDDSMQRSLDRADKLNQGLVTSFEDKIRELEELDKVGKLQDYNVISLVTMSKMTEANFRQLLPWFDKVKDEQARKDSLNHFWFLRSKLAAEEDRVPEAENFAARVAEPEFQALLAFYVAEAKLKKEEDPINVYQILSHVSRLTQKMPDTATKVRILFGLTYLYKDFNPGFAMDELNMAINTINRMPNPDLFNNFVDRLIKTKDFMSISRYQVPGHDLEGTFREISKDSADLPLSHARSINDNYLRTIAVIAIAKNCADRSKDIQKNTAGSEVN